MIKVYALSTCVWCKKLKKFLDEQNIPYECVDVDTADHQTQQKALREIERLVGEQAFPVTVVNGTTVVGYQPDKIVEALKNEA